MKILEGDGWVFRWGLYFSWPHRYERKTSFGYYFLWWVVEIEK